MGDKIRLGMDAKRAFCNYRGLGNYSRLLIEGLVHWAADEIELSLFTPKVSLREYRDWPSESIRRVEPTGVARLIPEIWRGFWQTQEWQTLNLDLYHGLSHDLPWNLAKTKTKMPTKTIVTIHDLIFVRHPELYPPWDRWSYLNKVKHSCIVADSIIAISEQTKNDLIELLNVPEQKIKVLYQAVHPRYYKKEIRPQGNEENKMAAAPYFLYVGAFEERKNILRLIKAFAHVQKSTGHRLLLIGKGGLKSQIQELIHSLSLQDFVQILSEVSSNELPLYYQGATAVTYPSLFEGFGLPIAEALMSETLVLTSSGGCFPESGGPGAFYVDPLQEEEIAAKLEEIAGLSLEVRSQRLALGSIHCQNFHWQSTSKKLLTHYQQVLRC